MVHLLPATFEGSPLEISSGRAGSAELRSLLTASSRSGLEVLRLNSAGALVARQVVGLLDAGPCAVEILPKTFRGAEDGSNPVADSRKFLHALLRTSRALNRLVAPPAAIADMDLPVSEVVISHLVLEIQSELASGVPRRYHEVRETGPTLRGRVDFQRLVRQGPARAQIIPHRHFPHHPDNELSRLILATLDELGRISKSVHTLGRIRKCKSALRAVRPVPLTEGLVDRASPTSLEERWRFLVEVARLLLSQRVPDPLAASSLRGRSFLFPLDRLFEDLLRRRIPQVQELDSIGIELERRSSRPLLKDPSTGATSLSMRPDFLLTRGGRPALVMDAKWKRIAPSRKSLGLDRSDVYQMTAYMARYSLRRAVLLYPSSVDAVPGWSRMLRLVSDEGSDEESPSLLVAVVDTEGLVSSSSSDRRKALEQLGRAVEIGLRGSDDQPPLLMPAGDTALP